MKRRRTLIVAFILAAVLVMGIGYATLTDSLKVNGAVNVELNNAQNAYDGKVYFSNVSGGDSDKGDAISITSGSNNDVVNITINSLSIKDDQAVFTMTIQNDFETAVLVTPKLTDASVAVEWLSITSNFNLNAKEIATGDSEDYVLTVKLLHTPTEEDLQTTFTVNLNVATVAETTTAS